MTTMRKGFDNDQYIRLQSEHIRSRIDQFGGKLYLEFGGKLFDDNHASRVLPGFEPDSKVKMLLQLKDLAEIVIVISADAIEKNKRRGDLGITYDQDTLRLIDAFRGIGLYVGSVVLTRYREQHAAVAFEKRLGALGIRVFKHYSIPDYPSNIPVIVSDEGFGKNEYIETTRSLVIVTAPGPGSGKMAVCMSQLYHEQKFGVQAGYAKFETFPVWNLPLKHPVNLAYEAATADLNDVNMIDPFHLEEYGVTTVNYNRDVEAFPLVRTILTRITGNDKFYCSPTDMGVNMAGYAIVDDEVCREASCQEVIRRYFKGLTDLRVGHEKQSTVDKLKTIMQQLDLHPTDRPVVQASLDKAERANAPAVAIQLPDGRIITGKSSKLLSACSGAVLNAIKLLAGIPKEALLMSPAVLEPVIDLKVNLLHSHASALKLDDALAALYICAATDEAAAKAVAQLPKLQGCEIHSTQLLYSGDESTLRKMRLNLTCEPEFPGQNIIYR